MEEGEGATGLICSGSDPERAGRQRRVGSRGGLGWWGEIERIFFWIGGLVRVGPGGIPRKNRWSGGAVGLMGQDP